MRPLRELLRFLDAAALVATIALLAVSRSALPTAAGAGSTRRADEILLFIAWLGLLLLAVGLLYRVTTRKRKPSPSFTPTIRHLQPTPQRAKPVTTSAYSDRAFPLILKRSSRSPQPLTAQAPLEPAPASAIARAEESPVCAGSTPTISLLGPLTISGGRKHLRRLRGPTKELLAYLALHPTGAHRDQIIDALWPDQAPDQGRKRLWRAAGDARTHFGETILARAAEHYQLNRTQITIDLDHLDELLAKLAGLEQPDDQLPILERALALVTGEPLVGSDFPWAEGEQRRLHAVQLDLLERAGRARLGLGDPSGALADAEAGLAREVYNEQFARLAMEAEAALGLRSAVMARYEQLSQLLATQLGLQPDRETRSLYRQLLGQDVRLPT